MNLSLLAYAGALFGGALAFTVFRNQQRTAAHLCFSAGMLLLALDAVCCGLSWDATETGAAALVLRWQSMRLAVISLLPGVWLYFSLCYGRGNHREFLRRWKPALVAAFLLPPACAFVFYSELVVAVPIPNTGQSALQIGFAGYFITVFWLLACVLALMNLERTYRAAVGTMRWRVKFMIIGLGVLFAVRIYTASETLLARLDPRLQAVDVAALLFACALVLRGLRREGHFDSDVYPSHAVLQSSLTILLAGIYFLIIGILWNLAGWLGGETAFEIKVFVTLAAIVVFTVVVLSERAQFYVRRFVSRHFQRPLYDYRTVWRMFTEATASCVGQTELCLAAIKSVTEIFQALSVSIWLVDEKRESLLLAGSNFLSEAKARELNLSKDAVADMLSHLRNHRDPVDIDAAIEPWAAVLRECHPEKFHHVTNRVCVPLGVGGELLGFMTLGDRVGRAEFSWQDFDLLKCIGDEIAAGLLNTRLSEKLVQAKELEAFQTMSAFFVHDLKNTANTLNLMLQNLPVHFDDPAFRADALRGIGKTVTHINRLIGRLGSIRNEMQIKPVEADLNALINKSLEGWEDVAGIQLEKDFATLPKISVDPEQFFKVATNLIFNAREAVNGRGEVRLKTAAQNGWAVFAVSDNGCGMSREFMERSLFKAFQTTKKTGLGIGMFQSKMIVEAHHGRIEVESEPGQGTTFRVLLPLPK